MFRISLALPLLLSTLLLIPTAIAQGSDTSKPARDLLKASGAIIHTSMGDIKIALFPDKAPVTVDNFIRYAKADFYKGTIFHRVIRRFAVQGGGITEDLERKEPLFPPIVNESDNRLRNKRWTISMARQSEPNSATSQFFFNTGLNFKLDYQGRKPGYAVFGEALPESQHIIAQIAKVPTQRMFHFQDLPIEPILINGVTILP